jgi:hypothetical protein
MRHAVALRSRGLWAGEVPAGKLTQAAGFEDKHARHRPFSLRGARDEKAL